MRAKFMLASVALMLTTLASQAMPVTYAIMSTGDLRNLDDYKGLNALVTTHREPQFTTNLDADQILIYPQRVLVISGGNKGIRRALAQFNGKRIRLLVNQQTGPSQVQLQICHKKISGGKDMTYAVVGCANDGWNVTQICSSTYSRTLPSDELRISTLVHHLEQAQAQR